MQRATLTLWLVVLPLLAAQRAGCWCWGRPRGSRRLRHLAVGQHRWLLPLLRRGTGGRWAEAACHYRSFCTSNPRASVKWKSLSCTLIYLEKDMSLNTDSLCNETNTFQTAAGLSYSLKYSCGGVTWNMFPSTMLFSFDVCANAHAVLSLRLPQTVTCWRLCTVCFNNGTSYCKEF